MCEEVLTRLRSICAYNKGLAARDEVWGHRIGNRPSRGPVEDEFAEGSQESWVQGNQNVTSLGEIRLDG